MIIWIVLAAAVVLLFASLRVAQEYERAVVFRLGRIQAQRGPGVYFLLPFLEWKQLIDLRIHGGDDEGRSRAAGRPPHSVGQAE